MPNLLHCRSNHQNWNRWSSMTMNRWNWMRTSSVGQQQHPLSKLRPLRLLLKMKIGCFFFWLGYVFFKSFFLVWFFSKFLSILFFRILAIFLILNQNNTFKKIIFGGVFILFNYQKNLEEKKDYYLSSQFSSQFLIDRKRLVDVFPTLASSLPAVRPQTCRKVSCLKLY